MKQSHPRPAKTPPSPETTCAWLASIVEDSDDAVISKTLDGVITSWNKGAQRMYGYTAREAVGRPISMLVAPDRTNEIKNILERLRRGKRISHYETIRRKKNGQLIEVSLTISPIKTKSGRILGASAIARDITERKRAEKRFRLAVEAAPTGMLMVDAAGKIVLVNTQTEKLFGYGREELVGKPMELLVPERFRAAHPGHRAGFFELPHARAMGAGRDLYALRKDGAEVPVEIGLNPIRTEEGAFVLASIIDITERRAMEKRLAHSEVLAGIGGMVSVIAHEIRNPLGSIVMAAKAVQRGNLQPADQESVITVLASESERLNRTLTEFLQFARPREPKIAPGDLNAALREVLSAAKADPESVGRTVVRERLEARLPKVPFDPDQVRQVLWNVIRNALQALEGEGTIEVATQAKAGGVLIRISDDGPGIPPDQLEKIFLPFFTTKTKGTGLGLPTCRSIIHAHGGDIQVESAPGKGAVFTITLPARRPA